MAPITRCKFRVVGVKHGIPGASTEVTLQAQYPDESLDGYKHSEDHAFFSATPTASATLQIQNPYGAEFFQPGEFVYADFSAAPNPYRQTDAA